MFKHHSAFPEPVNLKAGLVTTLKDGDNSRSYIRLVIDWLMYIVNAAEKKITFGQQWYALAINVPGNDRLRFDSFTRRVPLELSREDFKKVIDTFPRFIDPVDREVHFLRTTEARNGNSGWIYYCVFSFCFDSR